MKNANPVNFSQANAKKTSTTLTLALFVAFITANNVDAAFSFDHFTVVTNLFHASANLHRNSS
jgi:hypothetical protein